LLGYLIFEWAAVAAEFLAHADVPSRSLWAAGLVSLALGPVHVAHVH